MLFNYLKQNVSINIVTATSSVRNKTFPSMRFISTKKSTINSLKSLILKVNYVDKIIHLRRKFVSCFLKQKTNCYDSKNYFNCLSIKRKTNVNIHVLYTFTIYNNKHNNDSLQNNSIQIQVTFIFVSFTYNHQLTK